MLVKIGKDGLFAVLSMIAVFSNIKRVVYNETIGRYHSL
ncbi:hypothetical protein XSR1_150015 [Xenorhabdus szentirmaii DSM 16338]|uniref:Uncharacterized protein n=1 Tax=Xenorhabdus szentirmaii DSM 16338 TaxID=1427518 RepID=W1IT95_9GAMM|nr:hypothetical protein XSR1_150015 [Xenorhabdus szentirmaii DSM 16338]